LCSGTRDMTFTYGELEYGKIPDRSSVFGGYLSPRGNVTPFPLQESEPNMMDEDVYFSWAPLTQIQSVNNFHDMSSGACNGIIFYYSNGGERAVGQCHLGVDRSKIVSHPGVLCFQTTWREYRRGPLDCSVWVESTADVPHQHTGTGWQCVPLSDGVLTFSFATHGSSMIAIRKGSSIPACQSTKKHLKDRFFMLDGES
jgi:hypothetical protein